MRKLLRRTVMVLAIAPASFSAALAKNVFVLPGGPPSPQVQVFASDTLSAGGSFPGAAGLALRMLSNAAGTRYFLISQSDVDTLIALDGNFNRLLGFPAGSAGQAGAITPDGRRVLLLTAAGLYIFDAESLARLAGPLVVGGTPLDVVVSPDSRYGFVLSSGPGRLVRIDLTTNAAAGEVEIPGVPAAAAVAPNGRLYVGATNRLHEIDGLAMIRRGEIELNGTPGRPQFTADGRHALARNTVLIPGGATYWLFDLEARSAVLGREPTAVRDLRIVANDRAIMLGGDERLYQVSLPGLSTSSLTLSGAGQPSQVRAIEVSEEAPAARALYYLTPAGLHRAELGTNSLNPAPPVPVTGAPAGLALAGAAATGAPSQLLLYNRTQTLGAGQRPMPLIVRAVDAQGRPLYNVTVTFTPSDGGVTVTPAEARTNAEGYAVALVDPGAVTGTFTVTAGAGTLTSTFQITVGTGPGGGPGAGLLRIKSGNGQIVRESVPSQQLVIVLRDGAGNPAVNVPVTWEVAEGGGALLSSQDMTDAQGEAWAIFLKPFVTPPNYFEQSKVRATAAGESVEFYVTTIANYLAGVSPPVPAPAPLVQLLQPPPGSALEVRAGEILPDSIRVRIIVQAAGLQFGRPIPRVSLSASTGNEPGMGLTASCEGGEVLTDDDGIARCDLRAGGVLGSAPLLVYVGGTHYYTIPLSVLAGLPARINKIRGDNQTGRPGQRLPVRLDAEVTDGFGNRLAGVGTQWSVSPEGGGTLSSQTATTDANGITSAFLTLGTTPGPVQITVTAGGASAVFTATIEAVAAQIRRVSGDNQTVVVNQPFPAPLVVQLLDAQNQPVPNAVVGFAVTSGSATLSAATATTDAQGNAQVSVRAGATAGPIVITATFGSLPPVSFNLTSRLPGPSLSLGSFVNAAGGQPGLVPGSIVKIIAPGIAPAVRDNCIEAPRVGPLPLALAEVSVEFQSGGFSGFGPLYYVCNVGGEESAAVQVPTDLPLGAATVIVRAGGGSATLSGVPVLAVQPGIFEYVRADGLRQAVLVRSDGSFVTEWSPARRGEVVYLFATGLGAVSPPVATNTYGQGQTVTAPVVVGVNHEGVRVLRAEYAVNMIGVYVVAFEVPATTTPGPNRPLVLAAVQGDRLIFSNGSAMPIQ